jgi:hypothetical protein
MKDGTKTHMNSGHSSSILEVEAAITLDGALVNITKSKITILTIGVELVTIFTLELSEIMMILW